MIQINTLAKYGEQNRIAHGRMLQASSTNSFKNKLMFMSKVRSLSVNIKT